MANTEKDRFWIGVFGGVFCACLIMTLLLVYLVQVRGLHLAINPKELARMAQVRVEDAAVQDLPLLLADLKANLPGEIDRHLDGLTGLSFHFGNGQIQMPPEITANFRKELHSLLQVAINNSLSRYDGAAHGRRLGRHTYQLVYNLLNREIIGKTYLVNTNQWFRIPVKIVGSTGTKLHWKI